MIDENAFGVLVSYFRVEEDEYGMNREEFVERFRAFRDAVRAHVREVPLGMGVRLLDVGHAQYVEVADGDHTESPLGWTKKLRARLAEAGFDTVAAVTHGGRWVDESDASFFSTEHVGDAAVLTLSHPSEPLRRALYADTASRPPELDDADEDPSWGPGLYLDTEAAEALGMTPKNAPTVLRVAGAGFYRAGK
jgi:hypothetical protein